MAIESPRLVLEPFGPGDFDRYFVVVSNEQTMKWITGEGLSEAAARKRFDEIIHLNEANPGTGFFFVRIKAGGAFIGLGKIVPTQTEEAEIGYALLPPYWGQGFGSEISRRLVEYAATLPGIHRLIAYIAPENQASRRILEKCGFTLERVGDWKGLPAEVYERNLDKKATEQGKITF